MKEYNRLREFKKHVLLVPVLLSLGCANLGTMLSAGGDYHFRKTRWGYTQEMARASEQGKRMDLKKGNTLTFNHRINDIPVKIVYNLWC